MSNHARRRKIAGKVVGTDLVSGGRMIEPDHIFPQTTPVNATFEKLVAEGLRQRMKNDPHNVALIELGFNTYEVNCSCGFVAPAPFGEQHAERIKENHLFRMGRGLDPLGARYRA